MSRMLLKIIFADVEVRKSCFNFADDGIVNLIHKPVKDLKELLNRQKGFEATGFGAPILQAFSNVTRALV